MRSRRGFIPAKNAFGEPYFDHVFLVGKKLALMKVDSATIAAGFCTTLLKTHVSETEIEKNSGKKSPFGERGDETW